MNNKFQQLMLTDDNIVTTEERAFKLLHKEIIYCGAMAAECAVNMAARMKEMRDGKVYEAAGFDSFGEYVESACGIKERQAYNYIRVYEELPKSFLHSNAKLGITKLSLIASLSANDREELIETTDVEDCSTRELKEIIAEKTNRIQQLEMDVTNLTNQSKDLKNITGQVDKLRLDLRKKEDAAAKLRKEIEILKNAPAKVETVNDPAIEANLLEANHQLTLKESQIASLTKQLEVASDAVMSKFKVKFEDLQRLGGEILSLLAQLDDEKKAKCLSALKAIIQGWKL